MKVILISICSSLSGVISDTNLVLGEGNTSCVAHWLCESQYGDGFSCKVAGGSKDVQTTNCEALIIHYNRWATKKIHIERILESLSQIRNKNRKAFKVVQNATSEVLIELHTLRGRQAVAPTIQVVQLLLFLIYLVVQGVLYVVKKCKKHQARQMEEELEMMESRLMQRKSKRRAAASRKTAQETQ